MRFLRCAPLVMAAWGAAGLLGGAQDPLQAVFSRIDQSAATFKGFTADIKRVTYHHILPDEPDIQTGTIVVRRAKPHELQMRIDINPPDAERVVVDSSKAEIYYPKTNSIQPVLFGKENKGLVEQLLLLGFGSTSQELQSTYEVTYGGPETVGGEKTVRIELAPKTAQVKEQLQRAELWISSSNGLAIQQKFYLKGGEDYTTVTLSNIKLKPIAESAVKLDAPKDARREKPLR